MGMLIHHTWLEQQEKPKADNGKRVEAPVKETEPEAEQKKASRRKVNK